MVVDKRDLSLAQVAKIAYKQPGSVYAADFIDELKKNGYVIRNRGPRGKRGTVFLNQYIMAKRQKNGKYAYKEVIDSRWPSPESRWATSLRKTPCTCTT
jgi:hypothetical protein